MSYKVFWEEILIAGAKKGMLFLILAIAVTSVPVLAQLNVTATAVPTSGTAPLDVDFNAIVTGGTSPYNYDWDFGDGTAHGTTNPITHTYNMAGKYTVRLTVTDSSAVPLSTTITVGTITVYLAVTINATPQCGLAPLNVCFEGEGEYGYEPYSYKWNFGDNAPASNTTEQNPCHGYMNTGIYTCSLTVTDSQNNTGTATIPIVVYQEPLFTVTATADVTLGLAPLRVNFFGSHSNSAYISGDFEYEWDFGDNSQTCPDIAPQHIYSTPGVYTVTLTVKGNDICGNSWSYSDTVEINVVQDPTIFVTNPPTGSTLSGGQLILESLALTSGTVIRVDYYMENTYVGSAYSTPYRLTLDSCGANGTYTVYAIMYDSNGRSAQSADVAVTISNPTLDGTNYVLKNPFRIKFFGTGFKPGAKLYFNGIEAPITKVLSSNIVVAKGGKALKALVPEGIPIVVSLVNKDGSCSAPVTFQR